MRETIAFASPSDQKGYVSLIKFDSTTNDSAGHFTEFRAHEGTLRCMCFARKNKLLLATASDTGTIIRVFEISLSKGSPKQILEFRRGIDSADIYSMSFSPNGNYLLVNSDKFDVHFFAITRPELNTTTWGGFGHVKSAVTVNLPKAFSKVAFISDTEIVAVCANKEYHQYVLTELDTHVTVSRKGFKKLDQDIV